jgi:hypothetical protein
MFLAIRSYLSHVKCWSVNFKSHIVEYACYFRFGSFENWNFIYVFYDLLFFIVRFDTNMCNYDNVIC